MEIDARGLAEVPLVQADVCIVGAGPAGLSLARELDQERLQVVLLESGGRARDDEAQTLSAGTVTGDPYPDLAATRHRGVGGTARIWNTAVGWRTGARYLPLDPIDFEARAGWPLSGWPFGRSHLDPFYARAHGLCGLGPFLPEARAGADRQRPVLPLGERLTTRLYRLGARRPFCRALPARLDRSATVWLYLHATALEIVTDAARRVVTCVRAGSPGGRRFAVSARFFVLAAGGIENARLLLLSGLGNQADMVGRCFMEHPRDRSGVLFPGRAALFERLGCYDAHRAAPGLVMGRVTVTEAAMRERGLLNASLTLCPRRPGYAPALRGPSAAAGGAPGTAGRSRVVGRRLAGWWWALQAERRRRRDPAFSPASGWSRLRGKRARFSSLELVLHLEQAPDPDNRVMLGPGRDGLGLPRAALRWRWTGRDQENLERLRALVAEDLARAGIGRVVFAEGMTLDAGAHHHLGTTRMHQDPRQGVVDAHCRVHDIANLFVAGSSVFPTGGCANPTLTVVALALRLANHLGRLASAPRG